MENLRFKCEVCGEIVEMKKIAKSPYCDWAYDTCVEWSDFNTDVPELSKKQWERSSETPVAGEKRIVLVQKPFDEKIGNEFWVKFEPAMLFFNGWEPDLENEILKCAMVRCRFDKIIIADQYSAWIVVHIVKAIPINKLFEHYTEVASEDPLDSFFGQIISASNVTSSCQMYLEFQNKNWKVISWTAQGDVGEVKWIYIDESGKRHLVMGLDYGFDEEVLYLGNVVEE